MHRSVLLCAVLVLIPAAGLAQREGEVTTVAPVTVTPLIGEGATQVAPEEIREAVIAGRALGFDAAEAARACEVQLSAGGPLPEAMGDFGVGALSASESRAGRELEAAAQAALRSLEALEAVRRTEASREDFERAELARQAAVKTFLDRKRAAEEARRRTIDLIELASERVNGDLYGLRALERGNYVPGCHYDQNGVLRSDVNQLQTCYFPGQTMRQFQADVDYRSAQRAKGQGGLYTPPEYQDLRLAEVVARQDEARGVAVLHVSGRIVNTRRHAIQAPPLWIEVADRFGTPLKSEQILAKGGARIRAGGTFRFSYALSPLPEHAVRTQVTFAPQHRPTPYLTAASACPIDPKEARPTPAGEGG